MSETGFKCPSCGQSERFTAYEIVVTGPVDVRSDGYEPEYGHGVHEEIPDTAIMVCQECGEKRCAIDFRNACMAAWWPRKDTR